MSDFYRECPQCPKARAALHALKCHLGTYQIEVFSKTVPYHESHPDVKIHAKTLEIHCLVCGDANVVLTEEGEKLRELFTRRAEAAPEEIPY